jgi:hypothetical protein
MDRTKILWTFRVLLQEILWLSAWSIEFLPDETYSWKKTAENAFMKTKKLVFQLKNAFYNLVNAFLNRKKCSMFKEMHHLPFHVIVECFLLDSKIVLRLIRKRSDPFRQLTGWVSFCSFLERSESDSSKTRSRSLMFSRETPKNGFFWLMNAF